MAEGRRPYVIGLCGRSGSGKSFVSRLFEGFGVPAIDTDKVYREMTGVPECGELSPCMRELTHEFGDMILSPDKSLNRRALADIVFARGAGEKLRSLNRITHRYILGEAERRIEKYAGEGKWAVIVDAPLLFESGFDKKCNVIIAACAPEETLVERIVARDGIDVDAAVRRLAVQLSDADVKHRADYVINTDRDEASLKREIARVLERIRNSEENLQQ
ncbi:MAG: dephospho-CoA kinase [Clostridia bacterium]|nr:dephospho-CoA kinase [Clostridia bacterium]